MQRRADTPTVSRHPVRTRAIAVLFGLLLAAVVGEVAARVLIRDDAVFSRADRWESHPRLGRVLKADLTYRAAGVEHHINRYRLRDREFTPLPAPGAYRIAVVGDSFVFGVGAAETIFPKVLERDLDARYGSVEVMSIGLPGAGTVQQNDFLVDLLPEHHFDLVVNAFCVGNDVRENRRSIKWEHDPASLANAYEEPGFRRELAGRSQLVRAVRRAGAKPEEAFYEYVRRRMELARPATYGAPDWQVAWERTIAELDRMRSVAHERGADFAVLLLPDEYQVDEGLRQRTAARYGESLDELVPDLLQRRLTAAMQERGVPVIDPLPAFRQAHRPGRLFLPGDTHFDEEGNRLAARALEEWLAAQYGEAMSDRTRRR